MLAVVLIGLLVHTALHAAPPTLYHQSAYQSPVRGEPDDLLLLAGDGFAPTDIVIYQATCKSQQDPTPPGNAPIESTDDSGIAPVVSTATTPSSIVVRLPNQIRSGRSYALWVRTSLNEWSNAIFINDARPLWLSPAYVYETGKGKTRYLKVIGRNLQAADQSATQVRLIGPQTVTVRAIANDNAKPLNHFVAKIDLPSQLSAGEYRVEVSKDDCGWSPLRDQVLHVRTDPPLAAEFLLGDPSFGGCRADDSEDDSGCFKRALVAAKSAGHGTIVFGKGSWVIESIEPIVIPNGISIRGEGANKTSLVSGTAERSGSPSAILILTGHNSIRGISFRDSSAHELRDARVAAIQLGLLETEARSSNPIGHPSIVEDIAIVDNIFDRIGRAIVDSGKPIHNLSITHNVFGAYAENIDLSGNRFFVDHPFRIDDVVIAFNTFEPGPYIDIPQRQGSIASEIGAGYHVDFSNNVANGDSARFLNSPDDVKGWRAAFFWHMNNNNEMVLVSENAATCTGDKIGDGEAIAFDNNANTFAFDEPKEVRDATISSVTVDGLPLTSQNGRLIPLDHYYDGHYIQIGDGPGIGQVRPIRSYAIDKVKGRTTFAVSPNWDVPPKKNVSRISVGREFWQIYAIANTVDHRTPLCGKTNRSAQKGGSIGIAGQTADSVVEGNHLFDTDGIIFHQLFSARDLKCQDCNRGTNYVSFTEIRNNQILGEYAWLDGCSSSGIFGSIAASPAPISAPTTVGYGISISHNNIVGSDAWRGGAIALTPTWYVGPAPFRWPLVQSTLIHHNSIDELSAPAAKRCKQERSYPRIGINLAGSSLAHNTVLYSNSCLGTQRRLIAGAQPVVRDCANAIATSCECPSAQSNNSP